MNGFLSLKIILNLLRSFQHESMLSIDYFDSVNLLPMLDFLPHGSELA